MLNKYDIEKRNIFEKSFFYSVYLLDKLYNHKKDAKNIFKKNVNFIF